MVILTEEDIYEVLSQLLPKQNDFFKTNYSEELIELMEFGINSKILLLDLVSKHRERVLEIDSEDLDDFHIQYYKKEYGEKYVEERINKKFWFAYPALLRIILELEFGEKYKEYTNKSDGV